jgi:hypothetical protein
MRREKVEHCYVLDWLVAVDLLSLESLRFRTDLRMVSLSTGCQCFAGKSPAVIRLHNAFLNPSRADAPIMGHMWEFCIGDDQKDG